MKKIASLVFASLTTSLLASCSNIQEEQLSHDVMSATDLMRDGIYQFPKQVSTDKSVQEHFNSDPLPKNINFYVRGLMQDLVANLQHVENETPVIVTSFIYLDGPEDKSSLLGNQLSQSLLHEIYKAGIPVLDHKVTDYIRVTEDGDFIYTKNFLELSPKLNIKYVFTGNLVKHQGGYLVNARVVGMSQKNIVSSAQGFIPADVANALLNSKTVIEKSEVPIVQG
ncbi:FlgO family outer membrane protein [Thalassotalea atypica]|uniref:FlgO family outer membrane protein n=1 Tax=Thalassotalea atypica TaxID=2054316 RepID=UPI002572DC3D|nr:FlgO family outer membrane protein [Thalassotalea atypica]